MSNARSFSFEDVYHLYETETTLTVYRKLDVNTEMLIDLKVTMVISSQ